MICDPIKLSRDAGLKPNSFTILAQRANHLVAKVETEKGPFVLKADMSPNDCTWDAININRLAAAGLPLQKIIAQGEDPVSYIILSWIAGEPLTSESPIAAQIQAGQILHRIHHLEDRPPYRREYGWDSWMKGWLDVALPWWGKQGGVESRAVDAAWRGFETLRPILAERGHHYMLHDGRPDHFLVQGDQIVGLIDVHDGQAGDSGMDLGVIGVFDGILLQNVRQGYEVDQTENAILDQLIPFYIFLRRLAAAEWHAKHGPPAIAQCALALANAYPLGDNG